MKSTIVNVLNSIDDYHESTKESDSVWKVYQGLIGLITEIEESIKDQRWER